MRRRPKLATLACAALLLGGCQAARGPAVALSLPSAEKTTCLTIFAAWDADRDGRLSRPEFDAASVRAANWSLLERDELFRRLDADGDAIVTEGEAATACATLESAALLRSTEPVAAPGEIASGPPTASPDPSGAARPPLDCAAELARADGDGDGALSLGEFLATSDFAAFPSAEFTPERLFELADTDRDGKLGLAEICQALTPDVPAP